MGRKREVAFQGTTSGCSVSSLYEEDAEMRTIALVALAAFVAAPLAGASPTSTADYTVFAPSKIPTMQTWKTRLIKDLDYMLTVSGWRGVYRQSTTGFAVVEFRCGADGRAHEITLVQSSKNRYVNKSALRAIEGLRKLHPMPAGLVTGQKVRANIIIAEDSDELDQQLHNLRKAAPPRGVASNDGERVIVLNAGLGVQG